MNLSDFFDDNTRREYVKKRQVLAKATTCLFFVFKNIKKGKIRM